MALRGPSTQLLDASGRTIVPGFVDAHLHLTNLGLKLDGVDLADSDSFDEVVALTAEFARNAQSEWILGRGWDQNRWPHEAFPQHAPLSTAVPDRPVALARVDGHALLANACAMRLAGVDRSIGEPSGGRILRDELGNPTGVFIDAAQRLIYDAVPPPEHARLVEAARAAIAECNRWGVTAVAEPGCGEAELAAQLELIARGEYSIRNHAMLHDEPALVAARIARGALDLAHDGRLSVRAIKVYADGALGSRGAALLEPYSDDPGNAGLMLATREHIAGVAELALRHGWQVCTHAIGDRANRTVLDAYEDVLHGFDALDARPRIEHAQIIAPADVGRFASLGVIPSIQATHCASDIAWAGERLGSERMSGAYPWRALLEAGSRLANGTDAPVEPASTLRTFHASISQPGRSMTRRDALASMTLWAAHANFQERAIGSIAPGKYADFVVLDRDWLSVSPEDVLRTTIVATYFSGERIYGCGPSATSS